jgi:hypothetical protein
MRVPTDIRDSTYFRIYTYNLAVTGSRRAFFASKAAICSEMREPAALHDRFVSLIEVAGYYPMLVR